jgi:serine/threonine protein kinase
MIPGTAAYMSPEQARGQVSTAASTWTHGVILLELLSGAGVPSDHWPTQTIKIVSRSSVSSTARIFRRGRINPVKVKRCEGIPLCRLAEVIPSVGHGLLALQLSVSRGICCRYAIPPVFPNSHDRDLDVMNWGQRIEQTVPLLTTLPPDP